MQSKKILHVLAVASVLTLASSSIPAYATDANSLDEPVKFEKTIETPVNTTAKLTFIDPSLKNQHSTRGDVHEEYKYSYYVVQNWSIVQYDAKPVDNQKQYLSIAKGGAKTTTVERSNSTTVSITGEADFNKIKVINLSITGNYTGTWSYKETVTESFAGPDPGYNSRNYYTGTGYDKSAWTLKKYDVYNVYNGNINTGTQEYYVGNTTVNSVYKPKIVLYSRDSNY
ncbi:MULTISPECIES: hypothetical protein [unclassified Paenibacillus]|uniref:hypothetical protein n=1 Tax=unclassified Paenibacillus TaxID=185978 RepID=UPI00020D6E50|nr:MULTISPECIES: hypothetical protein [unclassified Paenibacillus]EGL20024.1 hypothetical protein HMPREF9413_1021 [Paenibacillus sp. HGF7]EPD82083.1 hypothetical protein HMPREF1207_03909 [Paenibacillus sp. HGH0039]